MVSLKEADMGRITITVIVLVAVAILGFGLFYNIDTSQAQVRDSGAEIMNKLQEVIKNQQTIIQKLDEMKEELNIIKIRASRYR